MSVEKSKKYDDISIHDELPRGGNGFSRWFGRTMLRITGWTFKGDLPNVPKMVIAVGPHTSNWDFFLGVAVLFRLGIKIKFLGKHSIFVPVVRWWLHRIGGIPVDRREPHGVVNQVVERFASEDKMIFAVAPEGTRSPIFPWKSGFLAIAQKAQVPVVLIGFDFVYKQIIFGPAFEPQGKIQDEMQRVYNFYATVNAKYPDNVILKEN